MKILLVEDDALLAGEIAAALRRENFAVDTAADGEEGHHLGDTESYDAAVLDLALQLHFSATSESMGNHDSGDHGWLEHRLRRRLNCGHRHCGM
jgi:ActR/RegA family two-component response regulator